MFKFKQIGVAALTLAATAAIGVCGATPHSVVRDGHTDTPVWPAVEKAHPLVESTVYADKDAFGKIVPGTGKLEIYRLLGHPMYSEGLGGVHEWNYVFKFPTQVQGQFVTCQYKVLFDKQMQARETYWNPAQCADVVRPAQVAEVPAPEHPAPEQVTSIEVSADFLFDFGSAQLSAGAPAAIDRQVMQVLDKAQHVESMRVIGYTDRLGSEGYNQKLSQRRAEAVKQYLVSQGIPSNAVAAFGRGSADPVVNCPGAKSPSVVACLKPNRRVRIEVVAR